MKAEIIYYNLRLVSESGMRLSNDFCITVTTAADEESVTLLTKQLRTEILLLQHVERLLDELQRTAT